MAEEIYVPRRTGYTVIPNTLLVPGVISARAYGVLCYLLSHSEGWVVRISDLRKVFTEGRDAIYTALAVLVSAGYMGMEDVPDPDRPGLYRKRYVVYADGRHEVTQSTPDPENPDPENPDPEIPDPDSPDPEKPDLKKYQVEEVTTLRKNNSKETRSRGARASARDHSRRVRDRQPDEGLDPADLITEPEPAPAPVPQSRPRPDSALGLARYFQDQVHSQPDASLAARVGTVNVMALARHINSWLTAGLKPAQVRAMVDAFVADPSLRVRGKADWLAFVWQRVELARRVEEQQTTTTAYHAGTPGHAEFWGLPEEQVRPRERFRTWAEIRAEEMQNAAN